MSAPFCNQLNQAVEAGLDDDLKQRGPTAALYGGRDVQRLASGDPLFDVIQLACPAEGQEFLCPVRYSFRQQRWS